MRRRNAAEFALDDIRSAPPGRPFVVAQIGQSLDGRIATLSGDSRWINGPHALDHLHALRAAVDAVVVGVGTVVADNPRLTVRRVEGTNPARIVIDPAGRAPGDALCFAADGTRRFRVVARQPGIGGRPEGANPDGAILDGPIADGEAGDVRPLVLPFAARGFDPRRIVEKLLALGLHRILIEGGADTISRFIDADAVDRLHVLLAPVILGSGKPALDLAPIGRVAQALRPAARVHVFPDGDVLFDCDLRTRRVPEPAGD